MKPNTHTLSSQVVASSPAASAATPWLLEQRTLPSAKQLLQGFLLAASIQGCTAEIIAEDTQPPIIDEQPPINDTPEFEEQELIDTYLRSLPKLDVPNPQRIAGEISQAVPSGNFACTTQNIQETTQIDENILFDSSSDFLFPGALVRGDSAASTHPTPVVLPRQPITFSLSLLSGEGSYAATLPNPTLDIYRNSLGQLLSGQAATDIPANFVFEKQELSSTDQLAIALGVNVDTLPVDLKSKFSFNDQEQRSHILVKLNLNAYTVDINLPSKPSDFLGESVRFPEVQSTFQSGNPPLYVSSITYGMNAYLVVESSVSSEELSAALDFALNTAAVDIDGSTSLTHTEVINQSKISVVIQGGPLNQASQAISGLNEFRSFLSQVGTFPINTMVPIAYTLRYLGDNSIALLPRSANYNITDCQRVSQSVLVSFDSIQANLTSDGFANSDIELYGKVLAQAQNGSTLEDTVTLFSVGDNAGNFLRLDEGQFKDLSLSDVLTVTPAPGNKIRLFADFVEDDGASGDDDLVPSELNAPFEQGWRRSILLNVNDLGQDLTLRFTLTPL